MKDPAGDGPEPTHIPQSPPSTQVSATHAAAAQTPREVGPACPSPETCQVHARANRSRASVSLVSSYKPTCFSKRKLTQRRSHDQGCHDFTGDKRSQASWYFFQNDDPIQPSSISTKFRCRSRRSPSLVSSSPGAAGYLQESTHLWQIRTVAQDTCPQREPGRAFIMQINTSAQDSTPEAHTQTSEVDNTQSSSFRVSKNKTQTYLRSCKKVYPTSISRNASSSRKLSTSTPAQFQMSSPTSWNLQASSILGHHKVLYDHCYWVLFQKPGLFVMYGILWTHIT